MRKWDWSLREEGTRESWSEREGGKYGAKTVQGQGLHKVEEFSKQIQASAFDEQEDTGVLRQTLPFHNVGKM